MVPDLPAALTHQAAYGSACLVQEIIDWTHYLRVIATPDRVVKAYLQPRADECVMTLDAETATVVALDRPLRDCAQGMVAAVRGGMMGADLLLARPAIRRSAQPPVVSAAAGAYWALEVNSSFGFALGDVEIIDAIIDGMLRLVK